MATFLERSVIYDQMPTMVKIWRKSVRWILR